MSLNSLNRASNIEISSQLTGDVNIDTPQKVNVDALKLKMIKQEKKENFTNKAIVVSIFLDQEYLDILFLFNFNNQRNNLKIQAFSTIIGYCNK